MLENSYLAALQNLTFVLSEFSSSDLFTALQKEMSYQGKFPTMDESELNRKAIEEIVREMYEKGKEHTIETKINPLGRATKRFLDRTINSALTHNKRIHRRTKSECNRKLRELERKVKRHRNKSSNREMTRKVDRCDSESSHEVLDSSSDDQRNFSQSQRKKKHKNHYRESSRNPSKHHSRRRSSYHRKRSKASDRDEEAFEPTEESYSQFHSNALTESNLHYLNAINLHQMMQYQSAMSNFGLMHSLIQESQTQPPEYKKPITNISISSSSNSSISSRLRLRDISTISVSSSEKSSDATSHSCSDDAISISSSNDEREHKTLTAQAKPKAIEVSIDLTDS